MYSFSESCPAEPLHFIGKMESQVRLSFLLKFNASEGQALVDAQVQFQGEKRFKMTALSGRGKETGFCVLNTATWPANV